jgi:hypothetical protein
MKSKIHHKKLNLNKKTITTLERRESNAVYGGEGGTGGIPGGRIYPPTQDPTVNRFACCH